MDALHIDGGQGEGGGQVLRTSLALSAITQRPVRIDRIRAGRGKPGLLRQHLAGVRALAEITGATVDGDALGSTRLTFAPGPVRPGTYRFAVGSAGSANLVLQTVLPPLARAESASIITIEGGTHNDKAPPTSFLQAVFLPQLRKFGVDVDLTLDRWGFEPAGGGSITARITPGAPAAPFELLTRETAVFSATAVVCNLERSIAERELEILCSKLDIPPERAQILHVQGPGPGNVCFATAQAGPVTELFTGFGRRGSRAESIARAVVDEARAWQIHRAPVGEHLADQLLLPMALAGAGRFRTGPPSLHTLTNIAVIEQFLPVRFTSASDGPVWTIDVGPA